MAQDYFRGEACGYYGNFGGSFEAESLGLDFCKGADFDIARSSIVSVFFTGMTAQCLRRGIMSGTPREEDGISTEIGFLVRSLLAIYTPSSFPLPLDYRLFFFTCLL